MWMTALTVDRREARAETDGPEAGLLGEAAQMLRGWTDRH